MVMVWTGLSVIKTLLPGIVMWKNLPGISGQPEGLPQLPDGEFLPPMEMNCLEKHVAARIKESYKDRIMTIGRVAHITKALKAAAGTCQLPEPLRTWLPFSALISAATPSHCRQRQSHRQYDAAPISPLCWK